MTTKSSERRFEVHRPQLLSAFAIDAAPLNNSSLGITRILALARICLSGSSSLNQLPVDHRIQNICSKLKADTRRGLLITDLSLCVNLSPSRLRHLFKAETGQTLAQYRKSVRMEEARVLLGTTFLSVKEIMHRVGVGSDSHFAHDFKEAYGLSPTQCRAQSQLSLFLKSQPIQTRNSQSGRGSGIDRNAKARIRWWNSNQAAFFTSRVVMTTIIP